MKKIIAISLATLVVLLVIWGILVFVTHVPQTSVSNINVSRIAEKHVDQIRITNGDAVVELAKNSAGWQVAGHAVDTVLLENIWGTFENAQVSGPVSRNPENHSKFEVDNEQGMSLEFMGDKGTSTLIVGKPATSRQSSYVRAIDSDDVYVFNADLRFLFPTTENAWRDTTALSLDAEDVESIEITSKYADEPFAIEHQGDAWEVVQTTDGEELSRSNVPSETIDALFAQIQPLRADAFIEDESDLQTFEAAQKDITLVVAYDDNDVILEFVQQSDDIWWMQVNQVGTIYEIPQYRIDQIISITRLFPEEVVEE